MKDIYQAFINPKAGQWALTLYGRLSSVVIFGVGLLFSVGVKNINQVWGR